MSKLFKEIMKEGWSPLASLATNYLTAEKVKELNAARIFKLEKKLKQKDLCDAEIERFHSDIADAKAKVARCEVVTEELRERMDERLIEQAGIVEENAAPSRPKTASFGYSTSVVY